MKMAKKVSSYYIDERTAAELRHIADRDGISQGEALQRAVRHYIRCPHKMVVTDDVIRGYRLMSGINTEWAALAAQADESALNTYEEWLMESDTD